MRKSAGKITALLLSVLLVFSACVTFSAEDGAVLDSGVTVDKIEFNNSDFIKGMDVSSVIALENSGVKYKNENGEEEDLFKILSDNGVNYIRVRVWNNPYDENNNGYGGGNCDVSTAAKIGARASQYGMKLLVDFHYSDFWADPSKQLAPKEWANMNLEQKVEALNSFTASSLATIKDAGADIGMVQIGNETNNGVAGEYTFMDMATLLNAGAKAVRDFDQSIRVAIHFTDIQNVDAFEWNASALEVNEVDYDVFAVSYYPYWHGSLFNLTTELNKIAKIYGKEVMVAETSYPYTLSDSDGYENIVGEGGLDTGDNMNWEFSAQGQASEVRDVMAAVNDVENSKGIGVFYWEGAWITVGDTTGLSGDEYNTQLGKNKELWEQFGSGWASSYSVDYASTTAMAGFGGCAVDNQAFFDPSGKALPSLKVFNLVNGSEQETTEPDSSSEVTQSTDESESTDSQSTETTEVTESSNVSESTETTESTGATEPSDVTENTDSTETTGSTEPTDTSSEVTVPTNPTQDTTSTVTEPTVWQEPKLKTTSATLKAGQTSQIVVINSNNAEITYRCQNTNAAIVDKNGLVTALKTGSTRIVVYVGSRTKLFFNITVTSSPSIKVNNSKFKKATVYSVKKGSSITVKITGKGKAVNNKYSSTNAKVAKVTSKASATTVKIKGLKKGTATVKIKVNGVLFAIKVKVITYVPYYLDGMEVGSRQDDGSILFKVQKSAALNGRALCRLVEGNAKRKIVLPKKKINIERVLHVGNNKTIIATGATIFQTKRRTPIILNNCKKTNYNSLKNLTINGGTWQIKDNAKAKSKEKDATITFRFAHAQKITIKNARVDTNYVCHAIELVACKNVTVYNCKLEAKGKVCDDQEAEALQIDIATKKNAPAIASQGKKFVKGQVCKNITVEKCVIKNARGISTNRDDKWLGKYHSNVKVIGCTITGKVTEALCLHNVMGVTVKDNKTYSYGGDSQRNSGCIFMNFGKNGQTVKYANVFSGNTFKGGGHGLLIKSKSSKHGKTTITNNKLYAKAGKGAALSVSNCTKVIKKKNKSYKW